MSTSRRVSWAAALTVIAWSSAAATQPWRARVVARPAGGVAWSTAALQARVGESVSLAVVLTGPRGVVRSDVASVVVDGRSVTPRGGFPEGTRVEWMQVEPRREHVERPSPNPGVTSFSNAVVFGPRHGRWLGYDRLEYTQRSLPGGATLTVTGAHPSDAAHDTHQGAGSAWFAARVLLPDGVVVATPDASSVDRLGLATSVQRVSFRADDSYLGWLSTYFHVTSVFGSNGPTAAAHQSDRYTGADCADVLVGALRASGRRELAYTSVASIGEYARALTGVLRAEASGVHAANGSSAELRWGSDVLPGDLVTLDYADDPGVVLPRAWDHIGALVGDTDGDGVLSPGDTLRHMGGAGLEDTALVHAGAMRVVVWRWRERR